MPKKLAVTVAGAVSLGCYEAGVLYEVLDAIRQHNSDPATAEQDRILIDVLTGASAGGMTAIILAQKLSFSANEFVDAYDNPVYNAWVKRIDLAGLQATGQDEPALLSLFSSDLIETISQEFLKARYKTVPLAPAERHPAAADAIRVGVAMTNLNGVAYRYKVEPSGEFAYIDYGDQLTRYVEPVLSDNAEFWEPLRQAAVACGAFPIAFRTQNLERSAAGEPDDYSAENLEPWQNDPATFCYSDGGILQNQPIGMAKALVDLIDEHRNQGQRFYLFVSPHAKDPAANENFHQADATYVHLVKRLLDVVAGQSSFEDWITAQGVNKRIALLDERACGLKDAIVAGEIDVSALAKTATSLLTLFFPDGEHTPPGALKVETLAAAQARIAAQYKTEMAELSAQPGQASAFRDSVLAFETAAGLGARDYMTIYGITAMDTELASAGLQAFLGFFDQKFRDHDYDIGRTHARQVLTDPALAAPGAIGPIRYTGSAIHPIDATLNGLKLSAVPAAEIQGFKAGLRNRVKEMARELLGPVFSIPADPFLELVVDELVNRLVADDKRATQAAGR
jgi:Patatin-like phospholipase